MAERERFLRPTPPMEAGRWAMAEAMGCWDGASVRYLRREESACWANSMKGEDQGERALWVLPL